MQHGHSSVCHFQSTLPSKRENQNLPSSFLLHVPASARIEKRKRVIRNHTRQINHQPKPSFSPQTTPLQSPSRSQLPGQDSAASLEQTTTTTITEKKSDRVSNASNTSNTSNEHEPLARHPTPCIPLCCAYISVEEVKGERRAFLQDVDCLSSSVKPDQGLSQIVMCLH